MPYDAMHERQAERYLQAVIAQHAQDAARRGEAPRELYPPELARRLMARYPHWHDQNYSRALSAAQRAFGSAGAAETMRDNPGHTVRISDIPVSHAPGPTAERFRYVALVTTAVEGLPAVSRLATVTSDTPLTHDQIVQRVTDHVSFTDSPRPSTRRALASLPPDAAVGVLVVAVYKSR